MQAVLYRKESTCKNKRWYYTLAFFIAFFASQAQKSAISFVNKTYSGDTLFLLKEKDFITGQLDTIYSSKVNKNGEWKAVLQLSEPIFVRLPLYRNEVWLCVEPNKSYQIKIPNKQLLSIEDSLNTFFQPLIFYASILNMDSSACNEAISRLDYSIDTLYQKHIRNIHFKIKRKTVDSLVNVLKNQYEYASSNYFKSYLFYKIAMLKFLSYEREQNFIIKYYFNDQPVLLNNIAYNELFNQTFSDFLSYYAATHWGEGIKDAIDKYKSPTELRRVFKKNPAFTNDTLIDLVILKGLHDVPYSNDMPNKIKFSAQAVKTVLDSMILFAKTKELKQIAINIKNKLKNEEINVAFEDYPFKTADGEEIYLRNYKGKYVYVMIADFRSYEFLTFLKQEKASLERFSEKLKIVNIVLYPQKEKLKEMIKDQKLSGQFLFCEDETAFKHQLKIRALPLFMIWGPNGKIINNNASSPDERIIPYLMQIIKD